VTAADRRALAVAMVVASLQHTVVVVWRSAPSADAACTGSAAGSVRSAAAAADADPS